MVFTAADSLTARGGYYIQAQAHNASALHLTERTITEPALGEENDFMVNEIPEATQMVWEVPEGTDVNTAIFTRFDAKNPISVGTSHLCGCTSMVIISQRGVYASHYWENIAFVPDKAFRLTHEETDDEVFERTVIDPIKNGKNLRTRVEQHKLDASKIGNQESDNIRAFLVHPNKAYRNDLMGDYEQKWARIMNTVGGIISLLDPNTEGGRSRWQEVTYGRLSSKSRLLNTKANGKVLVKYDPNHEGKKKVVLWVETNKVYEYEWDY